MRGTAADHSELLPSPSPPASSFSSHFRFPILALFLSSIPYLTSIDVFYDSQPWPSLLRRSRSASVQDGMRGTPNPHLVDVCILVGDQLDLVWIVDGRRHWWIFSEWRGAVRRSPSCSAAARGTSWTRSALPSPTSPPSLSPHWS
ncbi:hypothetical protein GW17_00051403 [Ensete ventricosum]|nr:hypothetical protein GW17_00051403 [Ensete ventricosum]